MQTLRNLRSEAAADSDGDLFTACDGDCDDSDPFSHPYALDFVQDGIDQDCNGADLNSMVSLGDRYSCVIRSSGDLHCWGKGESGGSCQHPEYVCGQSMPARGIFEQLSAGINHSCALSPTGEAHCWGKNDQEQSTPPSLSFTLLATGDSQSCGLDEEGSIHCWSSGGECSGPARGGDNADYVV